VKRALFLVLLLATPTVPALAQGGVPPGPDQPEAAPDPAAEAAAREAMMRRLRGEDVPQNTAVPSTELAPGTVRVTVVDLSGRPVEGATVRLGMRAMNARDSKVGTTDADGLVVFSDLETGSSMAYRPNVLHDGATFSTTPFRLELDRGHDVRIVQLPTSHDLRNVVMLAGQSALEIKDERLHVVQMAQIANVGGSVYVFPQDGMEIPLPEGFTAFQSAEVMTDQHFTGTDRGFRLSGSLVPGTISLRWAYDLPIKGSHIELRQPMPFRVHSYVVVTDQVPGLTMEVDRFPPTQTVAQGDMEFVATEIRLAPTDPELQELVVRLDGIPGPGPERWIALLFAVLACFATLYMLVVGGDAEGSAAAGRGRRRQELLQEAEEVERLFAANEIGPQFRSRRMEEIVTELASLAQEDARTGVSAPAPAD